MGFGLICWPLLLLALESKINKYKTSDRHPEDGGGRESRGRGWGWACGLDNWKQLGLIKTEFALNFDARRQRNVWSEKGKRKRRENL